MEAVLSWPWRTSRPTAPAAFGGPRRAQLFAALEHWSLAQPHYRPRLGPAVLPFSALSDGAPADLRVRSPAMSAASALARARGGVTLAEFRDLDTAALWAALSPEVQTSNVVPRPTSQSLAAREDGMGIAEVHDLAGYRRAASDGEGSPFDDLSTADSRAARALDTVAAITRSRRSSDKARAIMASVVGALGSHSGSLWAT